MYYIETDGNKIIAKGYTEKQIKLGEGFFEITEAQYKYIRASATFEFDGDGNIVNIQNEPELMQEIAAKVNELIEITKRLESSMLGLEKTIHSSEVIK